MENNTTNGTELEQKEKRPVQVHIDHKGMLVLILAVVLAVAAILLFVQHTGREKADREWKKVVADQQAEIDLLTKRLDDAKRVNFGIVDSKLQEIGELTTVEYQYTTAGKFESNPEQKILVFKFTLPWTAKYFTAIWEGTIKAGIDVSEVRTEINEAEKTYTVHLPEARILSHEIDFESVQVLDQSKGVFNRVDVADVNQFYAANADAMKEKVIRDGLLEKAENAAKVVLSDLINATPNFAGNYSLVFK